MFHSRLALGGLLSLLLHRGDGLYDPVQKIEVARLYGNIDEYAYYFVHLLVGSPAQRVSVIADTGSSKLAFPCANCRHCGKHIDPLFDVAQSSTAKWVGCGKDCMSECNRGHCAYSESYTEGSSISGYWFKDWVRLGDAMQRNPPVYDRMGCHQNENKLFYTQKANGIFGMSSSDTTMLKTLLRDNAHINSHVFSMCLAEWGGSLVMGGYNKSCHTGPLRYVPSGMDQGRYLVTITEMRLDGRKAATDFGQTMIDSGTTYTYMSSKPYRELRKAIEDYCQSHNCGAQRHDQCWTVRNGATGLSSFPTIEVMFGSTATTWKPSAYLYRKGKKSIFCYGFKDDGPGAGTTLGATWMIHQDVVFDFRENRVGIAEARCPEFRQRPRHQPKLARAAPGVRSSSFWALGLRVTVAAVLGAVVAVVACVVAWRRCCRGEPKHVQFKEIDESGQPPQIVGNAMNNNDPDPGTFAIGDDDDLDDDLDEETEHFRSDFDLPVRPQMPASSSTDRGPFDDDDGHLARPGGPGASGSSAGRPQRRADGEAEGPLD